MSIDVLQERIRRFKNPTVLSLEPGPDAIPCFLLEEHPTRAQALEAYCRGLLDGLKELVPGVKFSLPCFAALGSEGIAVLERTMSLAKELEYYVILEGLSGDWGIPAEAAATGVFGEDTYYPCDGAIINGYCGSDGVKPYLPYCKEGRSLFVLVKSPNRSAVEIQDLLSGSRLVHTAMADLVNRWGADLYGKYGYSQVAAVVGASHSEALTALRAKYDRTFFLVTGLEHPRVGSKNCQYAFDRFGHGAAVCAGPYILEAWRSQGSDGRDYIQQAQEAARKLRKNLGNYVQIM